MSCHQAAVALVDSGFAVFPVRGKKPYPGSRGCLEATRDPDRIDAWWRRWPNAGVAIATGAPSGAWVLDVDGEAGAASLRGLTAEHGPLPATVMARTLRGWHLWWRLETEVRNSASRVGAALDVRGTGGYVVSPPSPHPDGGVYRWHRDPIEHAIAAAPGWLLDRVVKTDDPPPPFRPPTERPSGDPRARYVDAAIRAESAELASTPEGHRNDQLNRSAYALARFVAEGAVSAEVVARSLAHAAASAGLHADEIERTLRSALGARGSA